MKAKKMLLLATGIMFTFVIYGMAFGEGFEPPPPLPPPNSGPYLKGNFIVTYDKKAAGVELQPKHYNVVATLEKEGGGVFGCSNSKVKHIFSFSLPVVKRNLCYLADDYFATNYKHIPIKLEVGKPFGLQGIPVITELKIINRENCSEKNINNTEMPDIEQAKILGTVKIRIVPPTQK